MKLIKNILINIFFISSSLLIALIICESVLRIKHTLILNYDIEMWKYAKNLKIKNTNPKISHTHVKNKSVNLQNVDISINNLGQRDVKIDNVVLKKYDRRFLILGSSIALGWGVSSEETFSNVLNKISQSNNKNWIFVNGGIGNYNTERYINNYFSNWEKYHFTDIIVHFFPNDTEIINESNVNFFTKNTHIGVVVWKLINSYKSSFKAEELNNYYKEKYNDDYKGFIIAKNELKKLNKHCIDNNINCKIVLMPDIHQLNPYKLSFINQKIEKFSNDNKISYLDLLKSFKKVDEADIWNKYQDPHPNSYGHKIIAEEIYNFITK